MSPAPNTVYFLVPTRSSHFLKHHLIPSGTTLESSSSDKAGINTTVQLGTKGRSSVDAERIAYSSAKSSEARSAFERRGFLSDGVGRNMGKMLRNWLAFVHRGLGGVWHF